MAIAVPERVPPPAINAAGATGDLLRRDAYGPLRPEHVEIVETHASRVFLLERDVFKVKRPVDLGFLDYSTLEKREAACRAEVELNARLAGDVYQGVQPLRLGADGHASFFGDGRVIDWAVHMRRLPDDVRADQLLALGRLEPAAIDAIARFLAHFHAGAGTSDAIARFGSPESVAANVEENFAQTRGVLEAYVPHEAAEIVRAQTAFLRNHRALFERRASGGRVRDGHGDLRLEHVYMERSDAPTIIDCIEFNPRYRFADVCADVAFLSMDLAAHGRVDLAERLLARYAREANDFDLYALVDFYEGYRAFVRAKVAAILAADEGVDPVARGRAAAEARRHFLLACSTGRRPLLRPTVVAVGGVIASGKSTIAERIADALAAPVVDADRTRKSMVGVDAYTPLPEAAWEGAYDPRLTDRVYAEVMRRAAVVLESGRPVVLDASFRSPSFRQAARDLAARHGVPFHFVECRADEVTCRSRLATRASAGSVSDGREAVFDAFRAGFEAVTELPSAQHIVLDTTRPVDESAALLASRLDTWPSGLVA